MKSITIKIATPNKKENRKAKQVTTHFAAHQELGEGGYRLTHILTGYQFCLCRFKSEDDAQWFADGVEKLYGDDLDFSAPDRNYLIKVSKGNARREWALRLFSTLSNDPHAHAALGVGDIRSISSKLKRTNGNSG